MTTSPNANGADASPQSAPPLPSITFTFPIVFITSPPPSDGTTQDDPSHTHILPPEDAQNLFERFFRTMPFISTMNGPYEPIPTGPPKKHATQTAIDTLRRVQVDSLPVADRRCHICMQDYPSKKGPRSPYVEDVKDEEDRDVGHHTGQGLTTPAVETEVKAEEEGEYPLEMPCGHVFGSTCLKEWLYQSPTCPLCRVEVESYTEEPPTFAFPWIRHPEQTEANRPSTSSTANDAPPSDEMQADPAPTTDAPPATAESTPSTASDPGESQIPVPFPIAFQFIFSSPPTTTPTTSPTTTVPQSTATPPPTSTPNVSRPPSSHTVRHHPYARTPTPSPLNPQISTPIVPDLAPSVSNRPDLFCAQRGSGLCDHDITDESLIRLECGHAFHPDCLEGSMLVEGYPITPDERRCPRCRRWMGVLQ